MHSVHIDEPSRKSRSERLANAKRVHIYAEELRQLDRHNRAIAVVGDAPPIKFQHAPLVQACPQELSRAVNKGTPYVINFQTAEAQHKSGGGKKPAGSRGNLGQRAELLHPQTSPADEIEEERTERWPRVPDAGDQSLEV